MFVKRLRSAADADLDTLSESISQTAVLDESAANSQKSGDAKNARGCVRPSARSIAFRADRYPMEIRCRESLVDMNFRAGPVISGIETTSPPPRSARSTDRRVESAAGCGNGRLSRGAPPLQRLLLRRTKKKRDVSARILAEKIGGKQVLP